MTITSVSYTRLQTLSGDHHERVGATAAVDADENPDTVLNLLKDWVHGHLDRTMIAVETHDDIQNLLYKKERLEQELTSVEAQWNFWRCTD